MKNIETFCLNDQLYLFYLALFKLWTIAACRQLLGFLLQQEQEIKWSIPSANICRNMLLKQFDRITPFVQLIIAFRSLLIPLCWIKVGSERERERERERIASDQDCDMEGKNCKKWFFQFPLSLIVGSRYIGQCVM